MEGEISLQAGKGQPHGARDLSLISSRIETWGTQDCRCRDFPVFEGSQWKEIPSHVVSNIQRLSPFTQISTTFSLRLPGSFPLLNFSQLGETNCYCKKEFSFSSCFSWSILLRQAVTWPWKNMFHPLWHCTFVLSGLRDMMGLQTLQQNQQICRMHWWNHNFSLYSHSAVYSCDRLGGLNFQTSSPHAASKL